MHRANPADPKTRFRPTTKLYRARGKQNAPAHSQTAMLPRYIALGTNRCGFHSRQKVDRPSLRYATPISGVEYG